MLILAAQGTAQGLEAVATEWIPDKFLSHVDSEGQKELKLCLLPGLARLIKLGGTTGVVARVTLVVLSPTLNLASLLRKAVSRCVARAGARLSGQVLIRFAAQDKP